MNRMRTLVVVVAVALAGGACGGGGSDTSTGPTTTTTGSEVAAGANSQFSPSVLTIATGGTVTWVFGPLTHNVTFGTTAGHPANIDNTSNGNVSRTFSTAGTFTYQCTIHQGMTGTITVQ